VDECDLLDGKPSDFPMEKNHKFSLTTGSHSDDVSRYCHLVSRLIYLTITRPDLSCVVHILSQFMHVPQEEHMNAAY